MLSLLEVEVRLPEDDLLSEGGKVEDKVGETEREEHEIVGVGRMDSETEGESLRVACPVKEKVRENVTVGEVDQDPVREGVCSREEDREHDGDPVLDKLQEVDTDSLQESVREVVRDEVWE